MAEAGATATGFDWKGLSKGKLEALKGKLKGKGKEALAALFGKGKSKQNEPQSGKGKGDPPAPVDTPAEQPVPETPARSAVEAPAEERKADTRYKYWFIHDFPC